MGASSIKDMLGAAGAQAVQAMLADAGRPREGIVATLLGLGGVVLIWVYYSSQIILMGAEVTHAFAKHKGSIKTREQSGQSPD